MIPRWNEFLGPAISQDDTKKSDTAESMSLAPALLGWCGQWQESKKGRMADALAHGGDEGRDKLR